MQNFKVVYSDDAIEDIQGLHDYILNQFMNPMTARIQTNRIMSASETLAIFPKLYRIRKIDSKGRKIRFCPVDNYVILYSIDESRDMVNILHVMYNRRNINALI
ncbi:MAG: type II toxin-antitoxin system RelE/ParE family toxin [Synergistaceae bacterium]|nr:type II toxin-antitoxin system RelE/ParE family toxin [Synergistaceae bacterium]